MHLIHVNLKQYVFCTHLSPFLLLTPISRMEIDAFHPTHCILHIVHSLRCIVGSYGIMWSELCVYNSDAYIMFSYVCTSLNKHGFTIG